MKLLLKILFKEWTIIILIVWQSTGQTRPSSRHLHLECDSDSLLLDAVNLLETELVSFPGDLSWDVTSNQVLSTGTSDAVFELKYWQQFAGLAMILMCITKRISFKCSPLAEGRQKPATDNTSITFNAQNLHIRRLFHMIHAPLFSLPHWSTECGLPAHSTLCFIKAKQI